MATFSITPNAGYPLPPSDAFPEFIQFQENGVDLGGPDADTVNFANGVTATRGTGESANVVTVTAAGGGGGGPITWRSIAASAALELTDAENGVAANGSASAVVTIPLHTSVAFDTGTSILLLWESGVKPTVVGAVGVTVNVDANYEASVARVQGVISLINRSENVWVLAGDLTSVTGVGEGTVTAVGLDMPPEFAVSPYEITQAGVFGVTKAPQNANEVWAGPTTGADAAPAFRALVDADLPAASRAFTWRTPPAGSYTLVLGDAWNGVVLQGGVLTIPPHSDVPFDDGTSIVLHDVKYSDPFTIAGGAGVTLVYRAVFLPASAGQYATLTLIQQGIDNWLLAGDLEAA